MIPMKEWQLKRIKKAGENIESTITQIILVALIGGTATIITFSKTALNFVLQLLNIPTPLWATILLVLLCFIYIYLKLRLYRKSQQPPIDQENLDEMFGVYWNDQNKLRCIFCEHPLQPSSKKHDSSIFFCSNCNRKYSLRDQNGNHLTEAQAINQLVERRKQRHAVD